MNLSCKFSFGPLRIKTERIIAHRKGTEGGPKVVFVAAIHGNEPSGVIALQETVARLSEKDVNGEILAIVGNMNALGSGSRFIDRDLNRLWTDERIANINNGQLNGEAELAEVHEQTILLELMKDFLEGEPAYFIDLHTTSSDSVPFMSISSDQKNIDFVRKFDVPAVIGIENYIEGPLLQYASRKGHVAVAFEAGRHDSPNVVRNHRCFIKQVLAETGVSRKLDWSPLEAGFQYNLMEVVYRHKVEEGSGFKMNQGYENFKEVAKDEVLAQDSNGDVKCPYDGRIFMPLYQEEGSDGFFIIQ